MIPVQNKLHNSSTNEVDKKHRPTWSVRDRTREFRATIESLNYSYTTRHDSDTNFKPKFNSHSRDEYSPLVPLHENPGQEIVDRATQVNVRIMATRTMLSSFIDTFSRISGDLQGRDDDIANQIQRELSVLNADVVAVQKQQQAFVTTRSSYGIVGRYDRPSNTKDSHNDHIAQIVVILQMRLSNISQAFGEALKSRSARVKLQREQHNQYSALPVAITRRTANTSFTSKSNQLGIGITQQQQQQQQQGNEHTAIDMRSQQYMGESLQHYLVPTGDSGGAFAEARNAAIQGIESTIGELGVIYQRLATMIVEQGEVVQRIDANVEEMAGYVNDGRSELLKYLQRTSSNRWLMIKIFAFLILVIFFFSYFLM